MAALYGTKNARNLKVIEILFVTNIPVHANINMQYYVYINIFANIQNIQSIIKVERFFTNYL